MDDFVEWVNRLVFDSGFVIISIAGVTGVGRCISRGPFQGRAMHLTCGGKTLSNKKGSHQVFCGTSSEKTAHIFADLSDAFVKNIIPALLRLGVIMPEEAPEEEKKEMPMAASTSVETGSELSTSVEPTETTETTEPVAELSAPEEVVATETEPAAEAAVEVEAAAEAAGTEETPATEENKEEA